MKETVLNVDGTSIKRVCRDETGEVKPKNKSIKVIYRRLLKVN